MPSERVAKEGLGEAELFHVSSDCHELNMMTTHAGINPFFGQDATETASEHKEENYIESHSV